MKWPEDRFELLYSEPSRNGIYKSAEFHGSGVKIVNMGELFAYNFISAQDMKRVQLSEAESDRVRIVNGDLLFGRRSLVESGAGKCSLVTDLNEPTTFESSLIRVRLDKAKANARFYYYWFLSKVGRGRISAIVSGTNVKGIRGSELKNIIVPLPSRTEQDEIADILSTYDDLIENNRRRIQLLDESARLLYKEWFVHLRFPGHEHVKIKDGVPEGWEKVHLRTICSEVKELIDPKNIEPDTPYIGLEHIPRKSVTLSDWGMASEVSSTKHKYTAGNILFGKIRSYFHKVGFTLTDGITSSDAIVIRPVNEELWPITLMLTSSDHFVDVSAKTAKEGSKMPRADWQHLQSYPLLLPPKPILLSFNESIFNITSMLKSLALQNRKLIQARDFLLPRLMNGEIAV
jgi:type I restriction enzyme, S subunit